MIANCHDWLCEPVGPNHLRIEIVFLGDLGVNLAIMPLWKSWVLFAYRPIYIGKNQNPKNLGFLLYRLHCQKNP